MIIHRAGVNAVILYFANSISLRTHRQVLRCYKKLLQIKTVAWISIIPSYTSILIHFDPLYLHEEELIDRLKQICTDSSPSFSEPESHEIKLIPALYDTQVGWDLDRISRQKRLTKEQIIYFHTTTIYHVYAVGFLPGFAYMARVNAHIVLPRLKTPRPFVPAGSIGIADQQTAVYPMRSAGGWNIIGRSPLKFFDAKKSGKPLLQVGMRVRFIAISCEVFKQLGGSLT